MDDIAIIKSKHREIFGAEPELIVHAPGRVNLIGEHTDYSEGYVLPVAINMGISLGISKIEGSKVIAVYSVDYDKKVVSLYSDLVKSTVDWFNYPMGVVKVLIKQGFEFEGVRITFTGNVPVGAGLSSSAALEIAVAYAIQSLYHLDIEGAHLAKICQQAEHEVVGVKCGIMDQYISRMGKRDNALLIDCRTLEYRHVPLNLQSACFLITNSNVPHQLARSKYNERVAECEEAVKVLASSKPGTSLRDFTLDDFEENRNHLAANIRKRAFHVISENTRVLQAENSLQKGDLAEFGKLMNESHDSLKIYYEVSSPELDWLVESAQAIPGCYGSRMTGAGFGGCTITLIDRASVAQYREKIKEYEPKFGFKPVGYDVIMTEGVRAIGP